ncbi:hypothetical protein P4K64_17100 [Bacillus cereus]|uniref:hypothetical protein n=1 Tax=Bacillus TaxID=1386 RepID=UPI000BF5B7B4|nr:MULTISPECIES: hypothetical protein [Bacillus]PFA91228.1 hypothetical protein CN393_06295 [Bacillus cereus]PFT54722.1 hypothetical protein COK67_28600 [Bacillus cereus]
MEQVDVVYALIYDNTNRKILMVGVPPAFRKKPTLRACKILCEKSGDIGNHRGAKRRSRIGMYKKMHRVIEKEKDESLVRVRGRLSLCY